MAGGRSFGPGDDAPYAGLPDPSGATNVGTREVYNADGNAVAAYSPQAFAGSGGVSNPNPEFMESIAHDQDDRDDSDSTPIRRQRCPHPRALAAKDKRSPANSSGNGLCTTVAAYDGDGNAVKLTLPTGTDPSDPHASNRCVGSLGRATTWRPRRANRIRLMTVRRSPLRPIPTTGRQGRTHHRCARQPDSDGLHPQTSWCPRRSVRATRTVRAPRCRRRRPPATTPTETRLR